jgi:hypothetical protein
MKYLIAVHCGSSSSLSDTDSLYDAKLFRMMMIPSLAVLVVVVIVTLVVVQVTRT